MAGRKNFGLKLENKCDIMVIAKRCGECIAENFCKITT